MQSGYCNGIKKKRKVQVYQREKSQVRARQQRGGGIDIGPHQALISLLRMCYKSGLIIRRHRQRTRTTSLGIDSNTKQVHVLVINTSERSNRRHTTGHNGVALTSPSYPRDIILLSFTTLSHSLISYFIHVLLHKTNIYIYNVSKIWEREHKYMESVYVANYLIAYTIISTMVLL